MSLLDLVLLLFGPVSQSYFSVKLLSFFIACMLYFLQVTFFFNQNLFIFFQWMIEQTYRGHVYNISCLCEGHFSCVCTPVPSKQPPHDSIPPGLNAAQALCWAIRTCLSWTPAGLLFTFSVSAWYCNTLYRYLGVVVCWTSSFETSHDLIFKNKYSDLEGLVTWFHLWTLRG